MSSHIQLFPQHPQHCLYHIWYFSHSDETFRWGQLFPKSCLWNTDFPNMHREKIPLSSKCRTTFTFYYSPKIHFAHSHT